MRPSLVVLVPPCRRAYLRLVEWLTIEVFDADGAAWAWRDRHSEDLISLAVSTGAIDWQWHKHQYGVALEVCFHDEQARACFRELAAVRAALELAPDPVSGVLVYPGRGGGAARLARLRPRPVRGQDALALPIPMDQPALRCVGQLVLTG